MHNLPPDIMQQMREKLCRPEGTLAFKFQSPDFFTPGTPGGVVFEMAAGAQIFRLERDKDANLHFFHSSPGTNTRVATVDLSKLTPDHDAHIAMVWSPDEIRLHVGSMASKDSEMVSATGQVSARRLRAGKDGSIYHIGDEGVEVAGVRIFENGKPILAPSALEVWELTLSAVDLLATAKSKEGYRFEVAVANSILSILTTGFETYCKARFLEIEKEGISPNEVAFTEKFFSRYEIETKINENYHARAEDEGISFLEYCVNKMKVNFQSYEDCKNAFNKAYGVKFGEIGFSSQDLDRLQRFIRFRHRIVHVSPLEAMLNQPNVPPEKPVFSNAVLASEAEETFKQFIERLHTATLKLRPTN